MAAPSEIKITNFTGRWGFNRSLSDPLESCFALAFHGLSARSSISPRLNYSIRKSPRATRQRDQNFDFKQTVRPGGFDTVNKYVIDGEKRTDTVPIFGEVTVHNTYLNRDQVTSEQTFGTGIQGDAEKDVAMLEVVESEKMGWRAEVLWVFETIDGEYRFCKYNTITKDGKKATAKLIHDYIGPPN